jgi:hypothetical protein
MHKQKAGPERSRLDSLRNSEPGGEAFMPATGKVELRAAFSMLKNSFELLL